MGNCPYVSRGEEGYVALDAFYQPESVREMAYEIAAASPKHPFNAILEWVIQNVPYQTDRMNFNMEDWWQYPQESMVRERGDCEDQSFLVASMLEALGYTTRVVVGGTPYGYHAWCEAEDGSGCWWLLETTIGRAFKISSRAALGYEAEFFVNSVDGCVTDTDESY